MRFLFVLALVTGCGGIEEPISAPNYATSEGGEMLVVEAGVKTLANGDKKKQGLCVLQTSMADLSERRLLTVAGALSKKQLEYDLHPVTDGMSQFLLWTGVAGMVLISLGLPFDFKWERFHPFRFKWERSRPIPGFLVPGLVLFVGANAYFMVRTVNQANKIISEREELEVSDKRMMKFIARIRDTKGKYSGNCDHLK